MRILVTGAGGQLGLALQKALEGEDVIALTRAELDVTDGAAVSRTIAGAASTSLPARPEVSKDEQSAEASYAVIHSAAWTDTAACERDPAEAIRRNAESARNVAEACRHAGALMVYVGSNEVFGGEKRAPYTEDDTTNPLNAYARSKLAGEQAVRRTLPQHQIVRTSWLYGPGRVSFPEKILQNAREKGALKLVTDEVASPTWTADLAQAIAQLIRTNEYGVFHVANAGECSRKEWAEEVLRLAGIDVPVEATTQAAFNLPYVKPVYSTLANTRAAALGISLRPWREALREHMAATGELAATGASR